MTVWKFTPGTYGKYWDFCLENNLIAMGWSNVGHLSWFNSKKELKRKCDDAKYNTGTPRTSEVQLWDFKNIQEKDLIVSYALKTIHGIGIVTGGYFYEGSKEKAIDPKRPRKYAHRYNVCWLAVPNYDISNDEKLLINKKGALTYTGTIHRLTDSYTIEKIKQLLLNELF
ncbi:unnamed protein product [marine sediment metagenome]|uniref:Uncharacterized protein n=1 Tax=marine sediment metagenome TaxID=412755 RepID=X0RLN0_9ZZZZ